MSIPKNEIDLTILNTPQPQASSTVERKRLQRNMKEPSDMEVPERDIKPNSNRQSSNSSLGILSLGDVEDIQEFLIAKKDVDSIKTIERTSNINETLAMQRFLAQKAMDKIDSKSKGNTGGLPSYLLKPTQLADFGNTGTPTKNESTINLSDFEKSLAKTSNTTDGLTFEAKEISARSSSFGTPMDCNSKANDILDLRSPSPVRGMSNDFASQYQSICDRLRKSDISIAQVCDRSNKLGMHTQPLGSLPLPDIDSINITADSSNSSWSPAMQDSLILKLKNEVFMPAEMAEDKLLADELSWRKAKDIIPVNTFNDKESNKYFNLSSFSGYIGDADISLKSNTNEKVSISEFFKRKTEDVDNLNLKTSPEKKHDPVPLINITNNTFKDDESENQITNTTNAMQSDLSRMSTGSMLSCSRIAELLSQIQVEDTPTRVLNILLNKKSPTKNNNANTLSGTSSEGSTLKYMCAVDSLSPTSKDTLKENSFTNITPIRKEKQKRGNILRDVTNDQIIELSDSEGDWVDAKSNIILTHNNNKSVSSIAESPSLTCSELEFSEDERSNSACSSDNWIQIEQETKIPTLYVNVSENIPVTLLSKTNHWLHVKVSIKSITSDKFVENIAKTEILNGEGVLKPCASEQFLAKIISLVNGKITVLFKIEVLDILTKSQQIIEHSMIIEVENPKIKVSHEVLDFEFNPEETSKRLTFSLTNETSTSLSLSLAIVQDHDDVFVFSSDLNDSKSAEETETIRSITILPNNTVIVPIEMRALTLEELGVNPGIVLVSFSGSVQINISNDLKAMAQVQLCGRVGFTKVQFKSSCMPFVLLPKQTKSLQIRNSGVVTLDLSVKIIDDDNTEMNDGIFVVDTKTLILKPASVGTINITFHSKDNIKSIKRLIQLVHPHGPSFTLPIEGIMDTKSPVVEQSPRRCRSGSSNRSGGNSSQASDTGTLNYLQDGKLPIESTRTELVWGCIKPGKSSTQEFVLRNRCSQRVRLQAVIHGSACFKFFKDHTDNATNVNLTLQALESRTITINFCPTNNGAAVARLMFLPVASETSYSKRQMIQLYGYGGYSLIDVQKVAKDTSGRMWLSFGHLNYQDTLNQVFVLRNTGTLAAFACLSVCCEVPFMDTNINISPTEMVIEPNKEIEVFVNFTPRRDDFKYIKKSNGMEVSEIASIKIITGPEPTRARIKRLFNKMNSGNQVSNVANPLSNNLLVPRLSGTFPGERTPADSTVICRENSSALRDLLRDVDNRELVLTIERNLSAECSTYEDAIDETCFFQSLVCNDTTLMPTGRVSGGYCTVEPRRILLELPSETQAAVLVRSHHSRPMPFEVCVPQAAVDAGLEATPLVGVVAPGDVAVVTAQCNRVRVRLPLTCVFMIYVENEVMEIEVKIVGIQSRLSIKNEIKS